MDPASTPSWLLARQDRTVLLVALQPGASRSGLAGLHDGALRLRVSAPPLQGRANAAMCDWLAQQLHCARTRVRVLRGDTSRRKQVEVQLPPQQVRAALEALLELAAAPPGAAGNGLPASRQTSR